MLFKNCRHKIVSIAVSYTHLDVYKRQEDKQAVADLFLLTDKPVLYVANVDEASMHTGNKFSDALIEAVKDEGNQVIVMTNAIEAQIAELENPEDKAMFCLLYTSRCV